MRRFCVVGGFTVANVYDEHLAFVRNYSEARNTYDGLPSNVWGTNADSSKPSYPPSRTAFPLSKPAMRKTHIEWKLHHGNGSSYGNFGPSREIADWEYADGTPAPISLRRYAFKHHQDHLLFQLIRSAAKVEELEASNQLPRIPGTAEQRDWDPEIPLFLDDLDERGSAPVPESAFGFTNDVNNSSLSSSSSSSSSKALQNGMSSKKEFLSEEQERRIEDKFRASLQTGKTLTNKLTNETLEPNTMFASYDPAAFISDEIVPDKRRPSWSRTRWTLTDDFLVPKTTRPTNTIPDE